MAGHGGTGRGPARIPRVEKRYFSRQDAAERYSNDIFLAMARNWHILVHFGEEFVHFGETRMAPVRKNLKKFSPPPPGFDFNYIKTPYGDECVKVANLFVTLPIEEPDCSLTFVAAACPRVTLSPSTKEPYG